MIDAALCLVIMGLLAIPLTVVLGLPSWSGMPADASRGLFVMEVFASMGFLTKVLAWVYFVGFESSSWQATPGKQALGMVVTGLDGHRIGFTQASIRYWTKLLSGVLFLGYAFILISEKRQGWHDVLAKTVVLRR